MQGYKMGTGAGVSDQQISRSVHFGSYLAFFHTLGRRSGPSLSGHCASDLSLCSINTTLGTRSNADVHICTVLFLRFEQRLRDGTLSSWTGKQRKYRHENIVKFYAKPITDTFSSDLIKKENILPQLFSSFHPTLQNAIFMHRLVNLLHSSYWLPYANKHARTCTYTAKNSSFGNNRVLINFSPFHFVTAKNRINVSKNLSWNS